MRWEKVKLRLSSQVVPWLGALPRGSSPWGFVLPSSQRATPGLGCAGPHPDAPGISALGQPEAAEGRLWTGPSSAGSTSPKPAGAEGASGETTSSRHAPLA